MTSGPPADGRTTGAGSTRLSRRNLFASAAAVVGTAAVAGTLAGCGGTDTATAAGSTTTTLPVTNGDEALARLMAGNHRFVSGQAVNQGRDTVRLVQTAEEQSPFAVILTCADSRVPPEVVFDEGIGDLFVVRVAGNTAEDPVVQGSIEYAIDHLHSMLLMVLGHEACGAVTAALDTAAGGPALPGQIGAMVAPIIPAAQAVQSLPKPEQLDAAVRQNVVNQATVLRTLGTIVMAAVADGQVKLVGAEYHLASGKVTLIDLPNT